MTPFQQGFTQLMGQRDAMYLQLFAAALVAASWYWLFLRPVYKLVLLSSVFVFSLAWGWGLWVSYLQ